MCFVVKQDSVDQKGCEMKAFAIDELGQPGALRDLPVPEPAEGQVLVRVAAVGLNPFDNAVLKGLVKGRMEHRFPLVPGLDASGTIDAVGPDVGGLKAGDDVFGSVGKMYLGEGTLAEFVTMSAAAITSKPQSLDHITAAAIPTAGVTALIMTDALSLAEGHTAVAIGATGGVGSFFVQLAARRGTRVVAACRRENADYARSLGAEDIIDYTSEEVIDSVRSRYPDGVDAIADMYGDKEEVARLAEQVRSGGRVASAVGAVDGEVLKTRGIEATNVVGMVATEALDALAKMLEAGEIVAPEIHAYALVDSSEALAAIATGHTRGKIVVTVT
jgi:NADPH:quinone reductase-like Zn-dependent oxidoreductase